MAKKMGNLFKYLIDLKKTKGWTPVPNELANAKVEPKLTPEEFLLHFVIKSKPDDWFVNQTELKMTTGLGKGRFNSAIKGLKAKKLLKVIPSNETGELTYTYHVYDEPYQYADSADIENQYTENKDIDTSNLISSSSDQTADTEVHTKKKKKNLLTNTEEKEGKKKDRKDSDISIYSTLEKLSSKGLVCDDLQKICSRLKPLEVSNHLDVVNSICDVENDASKLKQALCDYVNSFAEKGDVITPTRFARLKKKLDEVCTDTAGKILAVNNATEGGWGSFFRPNGKTAQKTAQVRSYRKPERMMNKETGPKDHTRKESEEEDG